MRLGELTVGIVEEDACHHEEEGGEADSKGESWHEVLLLVLHLRVDLERHGVTFEGKADNAEEVGDTTNIKRLEMALEGGFLDVVDGCGPD